MFLFPMVLAWLAGQVALLGHDAYAVREAAQRRLDHPVWAALLPAATDSPEANARIASLKKKYRPLTARQVEVRVLDDDFTRWCEEYLKPGRSAVAGDYDFFRTEILNRPEHYRRLFATWPLPAHMTWNFWQGALHANDFPAWLDYLDYHRGVAPAPRQK